MSKLDKIIKPLKKLLTQLEAYKSALQTDNEVKKMQMDKLQLGINHNNKEYIRSSTVAHKLKELIGE